MNKRAIGIALVLCMILLLTIAPEVKALSYTDTEFDFQSWTNDVNGVGTLSNGLIQDCEDDLDGTDGWTKDANGICGVDSTNYYEGTKSANISSSSGTQGITKTFTIDKVDTTTFDNLILVVWISGEQNSANEGQGYIRLRFEHASSGYVYDDLSYVLANSTYFASEWENGTDWGFDYEPDKKPRVKTQEDKPIRTMAQYWGGIRIGDANATGQYIIRNLVTDNVAIGGGGIRGDQITVRIRTTEDFKLNIDAFLLSYHSVIDPLPEYTTTGNAKGFYNESGLCLEVGSGESAYAQLDYENFDNRWDYAIKVTYSGTGTSTNISSSLNVDDGGWIDWNHTIATLGNDTFIYYTTNQSYSGEDIAGRYVDIDCPASSSIIIQSLTIREGYPSGGGGVGGGGGGGVAPETVVSEVVEGFTTRLFGIQYWQLLLGGIALAFVGHKYTKKKIHYRVPKQNLVFISGISAILLVFFWFSLSVFYMEAPAETLTELPFEFYIFGFGVAVTILFGSLPIKMQGIERAPNKLVFKSNDFANSVVKGIILLTSISFVLYYLLNLAFGFTADTFLVTQFQMEIIYAFQLGTTIVWFLHFVLPWIEEIVFRYVTLLIVAPFTDETGRCIFSAAIFGAFHYYVARTIGFAYFIYFFAGGLIFYSICYGTIWLEKYWKGMPNLLKFKGAGLLAAIIVHLIFNFMALFGANLLQTAWVVEI